MMEWILTSSVLILIVTALRAALKGKISLRLQYALWGLVLVRLLLPFSLFDSKFSVMNAVEHTVPGISEAGDRGVGQVVDGVPYFFDSERQPDFKVAVEEQPEEQVEEKLAPWQQEEAEIRVEVIGTPFSARDVIKVIWLGVGGLIALWFLSVNLRFGRELKKGRAKISVEGYPLPVYRSSAVETPCLFGLIRPAVYLTDEVTEESVGHVLAHELTHYRHGDHIWSALRCLCLAAHWYNPLVWLAAFLSRRDAELACDEGTLKRIGEEQRTAYGRTLIGLTCRRRSNLSLAATTMTGSKKGIAERILLIVKKPQMKKWVLAVLLVLVVVAAGCTFSGVREDVPNDPQPTASAPQTTQPTESAPQTTQPAEPFSESDQEIFLDSDYARSWAEWCKENGKLVPATAIYELFDAAGDMTVTLYLADEGACNAYEISDRWYAERFEVLIGGYRWVEVENPETTPSEYWLTAESSDGKHKMTFWSGGAGMIQYEDGSTTTYWRGTPLHSGLTFIAYDIRREYDDLDVDFSRIRFYQEGDAEKAADAFVHSAYGSHRVSALAPGNWYRLNQYEVIDWAVKEVSEDGTEVVGWFNYAFSPENMEAPVIWAGNTERGTGEYEAMLIAYREFVLQKQGDGYWYCVGLGTGGYSLDNLN